MSGTLTTDTNIWTLTNLDPPTFDTCDVCKQMHNVWVFHIKHNMTGKIRLIKRCSEHTRDPIDHEELPEEASQHALQDALQALLALTQTV